MQSWPSRRGGTLQGAGLLGLHVAVGVDLGLHIAAEGAGVLRPHASAEEHRSLVIEAVSAASTAVPASVTSVSTIAIPY